MNRLYVCAFWVLPLFCSAAAVFAAPIPEESRVYFSAYPAQPEPVRTHRDIVQWRLGGQLFDEGPCLEGVPFPVLVGTTQQIQAVNQMLSTSVQTFSAAVTNPAM